MKIRAVIYYIGHILRIEALMLLPAVGIALYNHETSALIGLLISFTVTMVVGQACVLLRPKDRSIHAKEGFIITAVSWVLLSLFGAMPFVMDGAIPNYIDAVFETMSGFTTTGATILSDVEALPRSLLYWRSFTHWFGGMGVLVFMLAIAPASGKGAGDSLHILRAESPGPVVGKLVPKMQLTARILYAIYMVMTLIEVVLLLAGGMPVFDSFIHAFGTAGTGGFSCMNLSIAAYNNPYFDVVIAVFMMLFGVNFALYHLLLLGDVRSALRNEELRLYLGIMAAATLVISLNILPLYDDNFLTALRHGYFQVSSVMTTTGYATTDFSAWPEFSRTLLLLLMVVGACAGSTGGGIKVSRLLILIKSIKGTMQRLLHPLSVKVIRIDGKVLDEGILQNVNVYLVVFLLINAVSVLVVSLDNYDTATTLSSVFACVNNIGPGLNVVGPLGNFSGFSYLSKIVLTCDMLIGRLEIFPVLMLFSPSTWRT